MVALFGVLFSLYLYWASIESNAIRILQACRNVGAAKEPCAVVNGLALRRRIVLSVMNRAITLDMQDTNSEVLTTRDKRSSNTVKLSDPLTGWGSLLTTDPIHCRVKINAERWITPGDYVVHEEFGVGKYLGLISINLTPSVNKKKIIMEPAVLVQYSDGESWWFKRHIETQLWLYRSADTTEKVELDNIVDNKRWQKRRATVEKKSYDVALNLIKVMAIRNAIHRSPYTPNNRKYIEFEKRFAFTPSIDQAECFKCIDDDMINKTRPMDRLICGDVGFGKTEVAMRAIYRAVLSDKQARARVSF